MPKALVRVRKSIARGEAALRQFLLLVHCVLLRQADSTRIVAVLALAHQDRLIAVALASRRAQEIVRKARL